MVSPLNQQLSARRKNLWYERVMAIIAVANLGLVGFDLTYVMWRDFWLRGTIAIGPISFTVPLPPITQWYDPLKGIEPHRDTQKYLDTVDKLEQELQQGGIESPQVQARLQDLREQSSDMVTTDPFKVANKSGNLEKIKNRVREHIYGKNSDAPSREAFKVFWSKEHLQKNVREEMQFFNQQIRPLIATNYYRSIGENGEFTNLFWILDAPFVALFALEYLGRTFYLTRRFRNLKWLDAMLWRWYDLLLLIPMWQWLRVIPVAIRLDQAELINLDRIRDQATQGFVSNIAEELTEAVIVQVINQLQANIQQGTLSQWLLRSVNRPYVDLNDRDEIQELTSHVLKLTVYQVLPQIKPDLEALIRHSLEGVLEQAPLYKGFKTVPIMGGIPSQINEQLVATVTAGAYDAIIKALEDKKAAELLSQLLKNFGKVLVEELQKGKSIEEMESLISDLMEEIKVNYVNQIDSITEDIKALPTRF
ncbi:MAG: hypothetical protein B0A82_22780 [Alkalinema sp. CACIAM 70d]|nr:MAG: hypothetical protein B0A82_22780 [Alkalinema sp. CACIAM 70d]